MSNAARRNHYDVTNAVHIADPRAVQQAITPLLLAYDAALELQPLAAAFRCFTALYAGTLPGHAGCDTRYHDAQHSLDCALACARLLDGHRRGAPVAQRLQPRQALLTVIVALFHDAGYVRRNDDAARNGAEYTLTHVSRSADFLRTLLPQLGFASEAELASRIVHFTGYEIALDAIDVADPQHRLMGHIVGTADLLAQTADRCYLEKCRDYLYPEFAQCGLAGPARADGPAPVYDSVRSLLRSSIEFNRRLWDERLDGAFGAVHRYFDQHFNGPDRYRAAVHDNLDRIGAMIAADDFSGLTRRPNAITREPLRRLLARPPTN